MSEQKTDNKAVVEVEEDDEDDFYNQFESFLSEAPTKRMVSTDESESVGLLSSSNIPNEKPQNSADKGTEVSTTSVEDVMADIDKFLEEDDEEAV